MSPDPVDVEDLSRLLYNLDKPPGTDWWREAPRLDPMGARLTHAQAHAVLGWVGDRLKPRGGTT